MERRKIDIFFLFIIMALATASATAQSKNVRDSCYYATMFSDFTMSGPFVVLNVKFVSPQNRSQSVLDSVYTLVARNGYIHYVMNEAGLLKGENYQRIMIDLKRKNGVLTLPYEYRDTLESFLLDTARMACKNSYEINWSKKKDRYVKGTVKIPSPVMNIERSCMIIWMDERRELVNIFSESGKFYLMELPCE